MIVRNMTRERMKKNTVFKGSAAIGNSGIKKHFKNAEPWQPLFELVWNGFESPRVLWRPVGLSQAALAA